MYPLAPSSSNMDSYTDHIPIPQLQEQQSKELSLEAILLSIVLVMLIFMLIFQFVRIVMFQRFFNLQKVKDEQILNKIEKFITVVYEYEIKKLDSSPKHGGNNGEKSGKKVAFSFENNDNVDNNRSTTTMPHNNHHDNYNYSHHSNTFGNNTGYCFTKYDNVQFSSSMSNSHLLSSSTPDFTFNYNYDNNQLDHTVMHTDTDLNMAPKTTASAEEAATIIPIVEPVDEISNNNQQPANDDDNDDKQDDTNAEQIEMEINEWLNMMEPPEEFLYYDEDDRATTFMPHSSSSPPPSPIQPIIPSLPLTPPLTPPHNNGSDGGHSYISTRLTSTPTTTTKSSPDPSIDDGYVGNSSVSEQATQTPIVLTKEQFAKIIDDIFSVIRKQFSKKDKKNVLCQRKFKSSSVADADAAAATKIYDYFASYALRIVDKQEKVMMEMCDIVDQSANRNIADIDPHGNPLKAAKKFEKHLSKH